MVTGEEAPEYLFFDSISAASSLPCLVAVIWNLKPRRYIHVPSEGDSRESKPEVSAL